MIKNAHATMVLHWLAIWKCSFFVATTLGGSILAALAGMDWETSDAQTKVMVVIGMVVSFSATMGAFIDNSLKQAREGKDPITGLTNQPFAEVTQKTTLTEVTEKTTTPPAT